jgi:hypothetical protein
MCVINVLWVSLHRRIKAVPTIKIFHENGFFFVCFMILTNDKKKKNDEKIYEKKFHQNSKQRKSNSSAIGKLKLSFVGWNNKNSAL